MTHFKMGYGSKQIALKRNENGQEISFKMFTVYNNLKKVNQNTFEISF